MNNETLSAQSIIIKHDIYPLFPSPHLTCSPCFWLHSLSLCWGLDYFIFKPLKGSPCISRLSLPPIYDVIARVASHKQDFSGYHSGTQTFSTAPPWWEAVVQRLSLWFEALHRGRSQYLLGSISLLLTCHSGQTKNSPGAFSSQRVCPAHFFWWMFFFPTLFFLSNQNLTQPLTD